MPIIAQASFIAIKSLVKLFETCKLIPAKRPDFQDFFFFSYNEKLRKRMQLKSI